MTGSLRCPKCDCPLDTIHLPEGVDVESCSNCFGAFYDRSELAVQVLLDGRRDTDRRCPKCGGILQAGLYRGELELEQCGGCRGLWFDAREVVGLRRLSGVEGLVQGPKGGGEALMPPAAAAAFAAATEQRRAAGPKPAAPAAAPETRKRKSDDVFDKPVQPKDGGSMENPDEARNPLVHYQKRAYHHFQTSWPVVSYVLGEFPWKAEVGEQGTARDFIHPPYLLSQDISGIPSSHKLLKDLGGDSQWSHGEYLEPAEVWEAFKLEGVPPERTGVAPAQPNPHEAAWTSIGRAYYAFLAAAGVLGILLMSTAMNKPVFTGSYRFAPTDPEKSIVTPVFELEGRKSNVEVKIDTNLSNQWAYFAMALINADTDVALDFGRNVSYYEGYDDEGRWTEGGISDTAYLPTVPPGRYYLRVEPETDTGAFTYTVHLRRDVARPSFIFAALLLLTVPVVFVWWRRRSFEHDRWIESDHPWVTSSDDDDDE